MRITIDTDARLLIAEDGTRQDAFGLYSTEAFEVLSQAWVNVGWNQKYTYTFSWLGRPIIQLPEDLIRVQEVIYRVRPDVVIETGVAHGGSLVYYASLAKLIGKGRVIGVDLEIRPHNRAAIEAHPLSSYITLIEGNSIDQTIITEVTNQIMPGETVLVLLDSNHSRQHVHDELEAYHGLVTPGSYIVATDGLMEDLTDVPRGNPEWSWNNPADAARDFAERHPEFVLEQPAWPFSESSLVRNVTHWPSGWLRRVG